MSTSCPSCDQPIPQSRLDVALNNWFAQHSLSRRNLVRKVRGFIEADPGPASGFYPQAQAALLDLLDEIELGN